jgi:hypothetical protein
MKKLLFIGLMVFVLTGMAYAASPDPKEAAEVAAARKTPEAGVTETNSGYCSSCYGWVWGHVLEAWRYVSGSEERVWLYFRESYPSYAYVSTGDARHTMFISGAASAHWLGTYWYDSYTFSNVRLWYY